MSEEFHGEWLCRLMVQGSAEQRALTAATNVTHLGPSLWKIHFFFDQNDTGRPHTHTHTHTPGRKRGETCPHVTKKKRRYSVTDSNRRRQISGSHCIGFIVFIGPLDDERVELTRTPAAPWCPISTAAFLFSSACRVPSVKEANRV